MPVVLLITTPPTVTWSNATLGVVAMLMLLPVWLMAMLLPGLKLTVSPAVICSLVAPLLLANVQPFCNSVMSVLFWLMVVVCCAKVLLCWLKVLLCWFSTSPKLVTTVLVAYSCEPLIASVLASSI